ncbi:unnamed protein product, partial [Brassica napus]
SFAFAPLLFRKKPQKFTGNKPLLSSQEIQDRSHSLPVEVTSEFLACHPTYHSVSCILNNPHN